MSNDPKEKSYSQLVLDAKLLICGRDIQLATVVNEFDIFLTLIKTKRNFVRCSLPRTVSDRSTSGIYYVSKCIQHVFPNILILITSVHRDGVVGRTLTKRPAKTYFFRYVKRLLTASWYSELVRVFFSFLITKFDVSFAEKKLHLIYIGSEFGPSC